MRAYNKGTWLCEVEAKISLKRWHIAWRMKQKGSGWTILRESFPGKTAVAVE